MKSKNIILTVAETLVIGGIIFAFGSPLFSPSEENNTQSLNSSLLKSRNLIVGYANKI